MILDLSALVIPIFSLASGLFLFLNSSIGDVQKGQDVQKVQNEKSQEIKEFGNAYHSYLRSLDIHTASTAEGLKFDVQGSTFRVHKVQDVQNVQSSMFKDVVSPPLQPTTCTLHPIFFIPLEPLVMAKGSRAPPGGMASV